SLQRRAQCQAPRPLLDQRPAVFHSRHARPRSPREELCRRNRLPSLLIGAKLPPLARPRQRDGEEGLRPRRNVLFRAALRRPRRVWKH
nr:hypothetical protein [Tanacetum cinerariifolium]